MTESAAPQSESVAAICRRNGWTVGTQLAGDEGYGPSTIRITAAGERCILAVRTAPRWESEGTWTLSCRDWRKVEDDETTPACLCDTSGCPVHDDTAVTCDTCPPGVTIPGYDAKAHEVRNPGHRVAPARTRSVEAEGGVPAKTTPEPAGVPGEPVTVLAGALAYIEYLQGRIAELEENVRALSSDPDRMVDPGDHEAAIAAMKRDMNSAGAGVGVVSPLKACEIAEEHMLRMAQASLGVSSRGCPDYRVGNHDCSEACDAPAAPEVREVPAGEIRDGDTVTVSMTAHAAHVPDVSGLWLSEFQQGNAPSMFLTLDVFTVSRPVSPLPDQPGAFGTATVRGVPDAPVFRVYSDTEADHRAWVTTGGSVLGGAVWLRNDEVCDFKPAGAGVDEGGKA